MGNLSRGKYAYMISDRSGQRFPYTEMVQEWNGSWVHITEYEPKHPQLEPKPHNADPEGLQYAHPDRIEPPVIIELTPNPFTTIKYAGSTYINVYSEDHGRSTGNVVRFRGPPEVLIPGTPARETSFRDVPSFDNVTDISNANGFRPIELFLFLKYKYSNNRKRIWWWSRMFCRSSYITGLI